MKASELFDLAGEVALVTGASSGIGARFAETLAAHGAKVVLAARRTDRLAALASRIGPDAASVALDVADRSMIPKAFDAAEAKFGPVTLLVNNAGISDDDRFLDTTDAQWDSTMSTNVDGVWFMAREAARRMAKAGTGGTIINIASILGFRVSKASAPYCVSKAAVVQMTAALALDLAKFKIRVNAIAPGYIMSEMTEAFLASPESEASRKAIPMRMTGEPSDLDGALLLLASRRAGRFMTGSTIAVDGGHLTAFV
jgi:3-oxoacyl-[acyl-carrier protein] reductase